MLDTKFEELELFGVTNLVEHPAQISPPGKFTEGRKAAQSIHVKKMNTSVP